MKVIRFGSKYPGKLSLALGFFDCVHLGHRAIIESAAGLAREMGAETAVFTFDNDPFEILGRGEKLVYTFDERCKLLSDAGADAVMAASFSTDFARMPAEDFLRALSESCDLSAITCGPDYRYGYNGEGDTRSLAAFCERRGIRFRVVPFVEHNGVKVSSTAARGFIEKGDIESANRFLGAPYFISGRVEHGRAVGRRLSYPTINLSYSAHPSNRLRVCSGVYATRTTVGGKTYPSITNAGDKPTFGVAGYGIETYIIDYNNDIYGLGVRVEFLRYMRPIHTFGGAEELREQLDADVQNRRRMENGGLFKHET